MKMALDDTGGRNVITAYEPGRVTVRERVFERSVIILPTTLHADWRVTDTRALRASDFGPLLEKPPEVVILGSGDAQLFPNPSVMTTLMDLGVGIEVMDNAAACRTYNILLAEDRHVALALIFAADAESIDPGP
ncbi:MAG: Mth938-like domain-containing protein [Gammaproteobacteria bacterium]|nr:Mth938-like domain-containing protein [Gammaproteobacteria bacterium]MCP5298974.1 Mth938-like domain-containing protein [Chromatiaceae bacterium]